MAVPRGWRRATDLGLDPFGIVDVQQMGVVQVDESVLFA